jgi:hypothetical protein
MMDNPRDALEARIKSLDAALDQLGPGDETRMQELLREWSEVNREIAIVHKSKPSETWREA